MWGLVLAVVINALLLVGVSASRRMWFVDVKAHPYMCMLELVGANAGALSERVSDFDPVHMDITEQVESYNRRRTAGRGTRPLDISFSAFGRYVLVSVRTCLFGTPAPAMVASKVLST
jgi:hypothetical protein